MIASIGTITSDMDGNHYKVVLADDFSAGYKPHHWGNGFGSGLYGNGAFRWSKSDIKVSDGELQVSQTRDANGNWTAGGFNSFHAGITITYGTVEFDARVEYAQGTMVAILMWPKSNVWPRDGEIDILETPNGRAMHTLHWAGWNNKDIFNSVFSDVTASQTHHYKMTWLPSFVSIEVNNVVVAKLEAPNIIPHTAMGFGAMGYVANSSEEWIGGSPNSNSPSKVTTFIDNVVMTQWVGASREQASHLSTKEQIVPNAAGASISALATESIVSNPAPSDRPLVYVTGGQGSFQLEPSLYEGPVSYLIYQFFGSVGGEAVRSTNTNDFLNLLNGDDAADGGAGDDVLDGGTGANFLTGSAGQDVFFLDGRGGNITWSTITDWTAGEQLALWGWRPGVSEASWVDMAGAEGYQGVTMHADLDSNGVIDTSITWAGQTRTYLPTPTAQDGLLWFV